MKLNKLVLALPALFAVSLTAYPAEIPPESFPSKGIAPDINKILNDPQNSDVWQYISEKLANYIDVETGAHKYIYDKNIEKQMPSAPYQWIEIHDNSFSLNNTINSVFVSLHGGSMAINTMIKCNEDTCGLALRGASDNPVYAYNTIVEKGSLSIDGDNDKAYNSWIKAGGSQHLDGGYAQGNIIDGGDQSMHGGIAEDNLVINGGQQEIWGGTIINTHVGSGSFSRVQGLSIDSVLYAGSIQMALANIGDEAVVDQHTLVYAGARQFVTGGISEDAQVYGLQTVSSVAHSWINGHYEYDSGFDYMIERSPVVKNAIIYASGMQRIQTGTTYDTKVYGLQLASGKKGHWTNDQYVEEDKYIGYRPTAVNSIIYAGGQQYIDFYGIAKNTLIDGGHQMVAERGLTEETTVQNGGESYIAYGAYSMGNFDVIDGSLTMQSGDLHVWTHNLGKGAYASKVNLQSVNSALYLEHNAQTSESTATIKNLTNNGVVIFGRKDGSDANKYSRLELTSLAGNGMFIMNTNLNGGQGDFLNISDNIDGNFNVKVLDSGHELRRARAVDGIDPHHLIYAKGSAAEHFALVDGSVDLGAYKYFLIQGDDDDSDNWYLSPTAKPVDPVKPDEKPEEKPEPPVKPDEPANPDTKPDTKPDAKPDTKPDTKPETKPDEPVKPIQPHPVLPSDPEDVAAPDDEDKNTSQSAPKKPELSNSAKAALSLANVTPTIWDGELSTLRTRLGDLRDNRAESNGAWGKYITSRYRITTDNVSYKQDMNGVMLGGDHAITLNNARLLLGGLFSYTHSELDTHSGDGKVDSYGLGAYATWLHDSGYYIDGVLKANHFRTENSVQSNHGNVSAKDNSNGFGASVEFGKHIKLNSYFIEPYIMGAAFRFRGEKTHYTMSNGMKVAADTAQSLKGEAGITFGKSFALDNGGLIKPYARLAVAHEFQKNNDVIINDTEKFSNDMSGTAGKYGAGLTAQLNNQWSTYAEVNYEKSHHIETPYSGHLGIRYSF